MTLADDESEHEPNPSHDLDAGITAQFEMFAAADSGPDEQLLGDQLCRAVVQTLDIDGAAISVYLGGDISVPVGASDGQATVGEALQFTAREGPCFDAYASRVPVILPDLHRAGSRAWSSWPTYAEQLVRHTPYQAIFAYPLMVGALPLGSLSLYRATSGPEAGPPGAAGVARSLTNLLLASGVFLGEDGEVEHRWMNGPAGRRRRQVWLAQGLTVQTNHITPGEAIEVLRAQAFSAGRLLDDIAGDIVAGRLKVPILAPD